MSSHRQRNDNDLTYIRGTSRTGQPTDFTNGLLVMPWENRERHGNEKIVTGTDVVVMLGSVNSYDKSVSGPFKPIPLLKGQPPRLSRDGNRVYSGTFQELDVDGRKKLMLTAREAGDNAFYVHVHTGFNVDRRGSIEGDLNKLILENPDDFKPATPGSFSLFGGSQRVGAVEGAEFAEVEATRLRWSTSKTHALIGAPGVRHDLWRIPIGAAVLVQDVTGVIFRIVNEGGELKVVDATKYQAVFNDFEAERRQKATAARASHKADRRSRGGVILPETSTVEPALDTAAEPA